MAGFAKGSDPRRSGFRLAAILSAVLVGVGSVGACSRSAAAGGASAHQPCLKTAPSEHAPSTSGMRLIEGGEFVMGARALQPEEGPPRRTRVSSFFIDETEVTNRDFARFIAATGYVTLAERSLDPRMYPGLHGEQLKPSSLVFVGPSTKHPSPLEWWAVIQGADWRHPKGPDSSIVGHEDWPVVQVGWEDAIAYARWLGRDLPTEAEWEYAARGGLESATYVWGNAPQGDKPLANTWQGIFPYQDSGEDGYKAEVAPVGCFPPNGFGLRDMAGNVWEWTRDWYVPGLASDDQEGHGPVAPQPRHPNDSDGAKHVIKGGSFLCADNYCMRYRPPAREAGPPDTGSNHIGFRTILRINGRPKTPAE